MSECHFDVTDAMYGASFCHTHGEVHSEVRESQWFAFWEGVNAAVQHWSSGEAIACPYAPQKRAEWEAEQGGRRWFTPAYQSTSGNIIAFGDETVVQEHAQRYADQFTREDPEGPDYFVATRISPPWMPVPDTTGAES